MPLTFVLGGQFGGEGKGLVAAAETCRLRAKIVVKVGGPNSAHSASFCGCTVRFRMLPAAAVCAPETIVFPAGSLINVGLLFEELDRIGFRGRILVDPNAGIIEPRHWEEQKLDPFYKSSGSTLTGTGAASAERAKRRLHLARDNERLKEFLSTINEYIVAELAAGHNVVVEGCQSYGLSNYHGEYPYVTSRCTTVGALLAQVGLGPKYLSKTILVPKAFPTRNQGGAGKLPNELPTEVLNQFSEAFDEHGGGSYSEAGPSRRVGLFDAAIVRNAILANTPDALAITGLDRLQAVQNHEPFRSHYGSVDDFLRRLTTEFKLPISSQSWGRRVEDVKFIE